MPEVSIVIPTKNRPELLARALASIAAQTFRDYEVIVVDDGTGAESALVAVPGILARVVRNAPKTGGAAARNTGLREAAGQYVAFLDDDDRWVPDKLEKQLARLKAAASDVVFSFTAVTNSYDDHEELTHVPEGEDSYLERALARFSGFLTSTLLVKREALLDIRGFDESLPSHQEPDLVIRLSEKYAGLGINEPMTMMNMSRAYEHIGSNLERRIAGRTALLAKHAALFAARPSVLAKHYFRIALWYRDSGKRREAHAWFGKSFRTFPAMRTLAHWLLTLF